MGDRMFSKREAAGLWFYVWGLRVLAFYIPVMTWFNHPEDRDMAGLVIGAAACVGLLLFAQWFARGIRRRHQTD